MGRRRFRRHGVFRIQQVFVIGSQSELDECPGVWNHLGLPAVVRLEALHRALRLRIPSSGGGGVQIVLSNQGFLDFLTAGGINLLLSTLATVGGAPA